jgi:ERCC4-type nuclease
MSIQAIMIDSREPSWVQNLKFGGIPTAVIALEAGDIHAITDDGHLIIVERKTPDDLLGTLSEQRLFPQMARMAQMRYTQGLAEQTSNIWPYLIITGNLTATASGNVVTDHRDTAWSFASVQGALLSIQEMGVFVNQCASDSDFEATILRLGNRDRKGVQYILPPRPAQGLGAGVNLIASLPGIGVERALEILKWAGSPALALAGLTDLDIQAPIGMAYRRKIRQVLGLKDTQQLECFPDENGKVTLQVFETQSQGAEA